MTTCCSTKCEKRFDCAKHCFNNVCTSPSEDYFTYGSGSISNEGCKIEHWCGELGNWRMFEAIEKTCSGCIYEDADGSTTVISNCVCCSRNVNYAKNDNYKKKIKT